MKGHKNKEHIASLLVFIVFNFETSVFKAYNDVSNMIAKLFHCTFASPVDPAMICVQMDNELAACRL